MKSDAASRILHTAVFRIKPTVMVVVLSMLFTAGASGQTIEQILQRFEDTTKIPYIQGDFHVELISPSGDVREIRGRAYQKMIGSQQTNRLFLFTHPPTVRDTGLLLHTFFDGRPNNMWIYLPAIRRTRRIALESSGGGYFMGSDFTYRDLMENDNSRLEFERLPDQDVEGHPSFVLRAWGRTPRDRQEHGYSHIISYYRKDNYVLHRRDFFDFNDELVKIFRAGDLLEIQEFYYPRVLSMENVQTGHRSYIRATNPSVEEIPDRYFTTRFLQSR